MIELCGTIIAYLPLKRCFTDTLSYTKAATSVYYGVDTR